VKIQPQWVVTPRKQTNIVRKLRGFSEGVMAQQSGSRSGRGLGLKIGWDGLV